MRPVLLRQGEPGMPQYFILHLLSCTIQSYWNVGIFNETQEYQRRGQNYQLKCDKALLRGSQLSLLKGTVISVTTQNKKDKKNESNSRCMGNNREYKNVENHQLLFISCFLSGPEKAALRIICLIYFPCVFCPSFRKV